MSTGSRGYREHAAASDERNAACSGSAADAQGPSRRIPLSLVAGLALVAFGIVLLLDRTGALRLTFGSMAPLAFAVVGAILLASGLSRRE